MEILKVENLTKIYGKDFTKVVALDHVSFLEEKYPNLTEVEIMEILNQDRKKENVFQKYGILESDSIILENETSLKWFLVINGSSILLFGGLLFLIWNHSHKQKQKELKEIETYVEQIQNGNYYLSIDNNTEEELSILKNEIYKVMILLKENAENSLKEKEVLKSSLEDISHQLKTPLTSILISLENLEEHPDMDPNMKEKFEKNIKREVNHISFFIQALLKLSKFDTNTITFFPKEVSLNEMIEHSITNVESLCDLKNITIHVKGKIKHKLVCDSYWQEEALTNILKNAVEHAEKNVWVTFSENPIYFEVEVINDGKEISKKDLPHIFERFYKGEGSSRESVGIGLSLSKTILEKENGKVRVSIKEGKTTFTIQYFKTKSH